MPAPFKTWTVLPHGKLTEIDEGVLTVVGELHMPLVDVPRRMTVVRLADGRLAVFSAISLDEDEMRQLEAYGDPAYLIVPGDHHRLDAGAWKARYPAMTVAAPEGALEKVQEAVEVDATGADFGDRSVRLITVPGTQGHELALEIDRPSGTTLVLNDLIANVQGETGLAGWLIKLMKFGGDEPQIPATTQAMIIKDRAALKAQLLAWAGLPKLRRIVVSHGDIIEDAPADVLGRLAATLD